MTSCVRAPGQHRLGGYYKQNKPSMEGEEKYAFISWEYCHYFEFVSAKDRNILVCCQLCGGTKTFSRKGKVTSNFTIYVTNCF